MDLSGRILILGYFYFNFFKLSLGQHDLFFGLDTVDVNTEYEDDHADSSCKWTDPPEDGFNFKPCSTGICRGAKGSYSKNGTVRFTRCKKHFVLAEGLDKDVCDNGKWSSSGHKCIPCGVSQNKADPIEELSLIHFGRNATVGDFPWMAGLYTPLDGGKWEQICGGTLIAPHLVLTAAHCFQISGRDLNPENIRIGLGKIVTDYETQEPGMQIVTVKDILKPERYLGVDHLYDLDLALVVLSEAVETHRNIMPACIDWGANMVPKHDETGYLAGYGITEHGFRSTRLKWAFQKYIAFDSCKTMISSRDQKFVTHDKFCTAEVKGIIDFRILNKKDEIQSQFSKLEASLEGDEGLRFPSLGLTLTNGSKADKGDSGGGLTFLRDGVHYVYGVVSTKLYGDEASLRLFTSLMNDGHRVWLQRQWIKLQVRHGVTQCQSNQDCPDTRVCSSGKCVDPCRVACGANSICRMVNTVATCACKPGYGGDPIRGCTVGMNSSQTKRYKLYNLTVNWYQAVQNCAQEGQRLAIVRNPEEQQRLNEQIGEQKYTTFWIGGSDLASEGNFYWIDDYKPMTWTNFREGDPNNCCGGEHCVEAWNLQWNDINCYREEKYVCEYFLTS